jgi:hypothetical protein
MISKNLFYRKKNRIKIAFVLNFDFTNWNGGFNVINNLIKNIDKNYKIYQPVVIVKKNLSKKEKKILKGLNIIHTNLFNKNNLSYFYNFLQIFIFGKSYSFEKFFQLKNIKVISHTMFAGKNSKVKSIFWMADFQHLDLKNNFSILNIIKRELNFRLAIKNSSAILLSSSSMLRSFKKYYDFKNINYFINRFCFLSNNRINLKKINFIKKKYNIRNAYFYISNQYWVHKNFEIIVSVLKYLKSINKNLLFVSSGSNIGNNSSGYFEFIRKLIITNNLENNFKYIGLINKDEVEILIAGSVALVNPSTYEGWNTAVEQAKALNKRTVLSNISVHREQKNHYSYLFNTSNYLSLSKILIKLSKTKYRDFYLSKIFLIKSKILFEIYLQNYLKIIDLVTNKKNKIINNNFYRK